MIKKNEIKVDTYYYEQKYGKPKGRNNYFFRIGRSDDNIFDTQTLTYTEAKKLAIEEAIKTNNVFVTLLPWREWH